MCADTSQPGPDDRFSFRMQAQDEQIRAQGAQIAQLTELLKTQLTVSAPAVASSSSAGGPAAASAGTASTPLVLDSDGRFEMDVDTGVRSSRAENYIPTWGSMSLALASNIV